MKLRTVEIEGKVYAEVEDGKPIYDDNGKDVAFDAPNTVNTITRLNGEAKSHREAKESAETKLKMFDGIEDPEAARSALATVAGLDSKELIAAGKVDEIKNAAIQAAEAKGAAVMKSLTTELEKERSEKTALQTTLHTELIGGNFSRSKFVTEAIAIPSDMVQSRFGQNFKVEDGKVTAYDAEKNMIYSKQKPGEPAGFEEALEILVDNYPFKDDILKGRGQNGGGAEEPGRSGKNQMTQVEFNKLTPVARSQKMQESGFKLV